MFYIDKFSVLCTVLSHWEKSSEVLCQWWFWLFHICQYPIKLLSLEILNIWNYKK